jgi:hypothetical protein
MIRDLGFYQENFLKIVTKSHGLRPFKPNIYQQRLNQIIKELKKDNRPIRIRILKCRQIGCSTWASSFAYHFAATEFYKRALIIANDMDSSSGLFDMCKTFYEFSPEIVRPSRKKSNAKELVFDRDDEGGLKSSVRIETAMKMSAGRSKTIQFLHMSEKAFWRDALTVQTGLLESVPIDAGTVIIDESTANGIAGAGETFYNDWQNKSYYNVFFKWTDNPEYERDVPSDFKMTDLEKDLVEKHKELTPRKLMFRRFKISSGVGDSLIKPEDNFKQEYPLTENEAFLSTGRSVFDQEQLTKAREIAESAKFTTEEI